jgi:hypothetical protein
MRHTLNGGTKVGEFSIGDCVGGGEGGGVGVRGGIGICGGDNTGGVMDWRLKTEISGLYQFNKYSSLFSSTAKDCKSNQKKRQTMK